MPFMVILILGTKKCVEMPDQVNKENKTQHKVLTSSDFKGSIYCIFKYIYCIVAHRKRLPRSTSKVARMVRSKILKVRSMLRGIKHLYIFINHYTVIKVTIFKVVIN